MCLAIPGRITAIAGNEATVDYGGVRRTARIDVVDVKVGDWVVVHAGYAIERLDPGDAKASLALWKQLGEGGKR